VKIAAYDKLDQRSQTIVRRSFIGLLVVICIVGLAIAVSRTRPAETDVAESGGEGFVEQLIPAAGSNVLQQVPIGIDLIPGYTAVLILNDTEIPEDQLTRVPELYQVLFEPGGPNTDIDALPAGTNCVTALVWRLELTRQDARPVNWCFNVT